MKPVYFSEDQLRDPDKSGRALFADENDPRSIAYIRILNRPRIRWGGILLSLLIPLLLSAALAVCLTQCGLSAGLAAAIAGGILAVYAVCSAKRATICVIRIYQRYAPASLRNKCRFEPSCSEYMILAIQKYGLIRGVRRGVNRLSRCNTRGGGFDEP